MDRGSNRQDCNPQHLSPSPPSPYAAPSLKVGFTRLAPTNHHHVERDSRKKTGFTVAEYVLSGRGGVIIETITSFLCVLTIWNSVVGICQLDREICFQTFTCVSRKLHVNKLLTMKKACCIHALFLKRFGGLHKHKFFLKNRSKSNPSACEGVVLQCIEPCVICRDFNLQVIYRLIGVAGTTGLPNQQHIFKKLVRKQYFYLAQNLHTSPLKLSVLSIQNRMEGLMTMVKFPYVSICESILAHLVF